MADATLKQVKDFFGEENTAKFAAEWRQLSEQDKADLRAGIGNGTFTY